MQPNILFFFTDQQRWDSVGAYGQPMPTTPNLDRLAAEGVLFENAYTPQPVCGPARACIQTGKYATACGCWKNGISLKEPGLGTWLSNAGYDTAYIGKWHLASDLPQHELAVEPLPIAKQGGYRYWMAVDALEHSSNSEGGFVFDRDGNRVDFAGYRADKITDFALDYLDQTTAEKPFFLTVSYLEPHHQNDANEVQAPKGMAARYEHAPLPGDLEALRGNAPQWYPSYLACVEQLDWNLGRLVDKLCHMGVLHKTIIVFSSDHGCHFATRNAKYKRSCHDSSIHIPLIVWGREFMRRHRETGFASLVDLPPTLLYSAGVKIPDSVQGRPLQELLSGASDWRTEAFVQISESEVGRAIRTEKYTFSVSSDVPRSQSGPNSDLYREQFLYDNIADPHQLNNLAGCPELLSLRQELAALLVRNMELAGEPPAQIILQDLCKEG